MVAVAAVFIFGLATCFSCALVYADDSRIPQRTQNDKTITGTVTLPNRARNKSAGMPGSRRSDDVAPRLHRRGPEGSVRFCGGEMALDVESVVSGCVG